MGLSRRSQRTRQISVQSCAGSRSTINKWYRYKYVHPTNNGGNIMAEAFAQYDPKANYQVRTYDVTYREDADASWPTRIYQPEGAGPFPALLDVHGGAWNRGSYTNNELIDQAIAASGLVVVAIALRTAPKYTYPAQAADVNYATRWLKAHARDFNADSRRLGGLGTSSGGHTLMSSVLRPHDPRYRALALPGS